MLNVKLFFSLKTVQNISKGINFRFSEKFEHLALHEFVIFLFFKSCQYIIYDESFLLNPV